MCGRFALDTDAQTLVDTFDLTGSSAEMAARIEPRYNIAPTQPVTAVRLHPHTNHHEMTFFTWGLIPSWAKDPKFGSRLINARSETVAEKPSFRSAYKRRRCLIPVSGFYEWHQLDSGQKQPMYIHPTDTPLFVFAGLWEWWQSADGSEIESCTILTTRPNSFMATIHNRMPVILRENQFTDWLNPHSNVHPNHFFTPYPEEKMATYPVSTFVNSPRNDSAQCLAPLA